MLDSACSILLFDAPNDQLRHIAAPSPPSRASPPPLTGGLAPGGPPAAWLLYLQETVISCDIATDPRWAGRSGWLRITASGLLVGPDLQPWNPARCSALLRSTTSSLVRQPRMIWIFVDQVSDLAGVAILHDREHAALLRQRRRRPPTRPESAFLAMANPRIAYNPAGHSGVCRVPAR